MLADLERRDENRFDKVFSVYIAGAWGTALGIVRNISEGGMFIEALDPYPLGSRMEITFSFPGSNTEMVAVAEVVHLCVLNHTAGGDIREVSVGLGLRFVSFCADPPSIAPSAQVTLQ